MTERVTGLGRRTREEIAKWNQMTALRFQTGGRHQTSPASLLGCHGNTQITHSRSRKIKMAIVAVPNGIRRVCSTEWVFKLMEVSAQPC